MATATNPGHPQSWRDHGSAILTSQHTNYNAIDPAVFNDARQWWIAFGSFFSGVKLSSMTQPTGTSYTIANHLGVSGNPVEAASVTKHGTYYLFVSWDVCCRGTGSTYNIRYGRATSITGPCCDKNGVRLDQGGGSLLLGSSGNQVGPGGQDTVDGRSNPAYHYYDANAGERPPWACGRCRGRVTGSAPDAPDPTSTVWPHERCQRWLKSA